MSAGEFGRLHETLRHNIVNELRWSALRPLQEQAIAPVLGGDDVLLLAPTAGGKTEAAFFPLLSRMETEGWKAVCVLYLCPIKALLNNLEPRLRAYTAWTGRTVGLWHGDVSAGARARILHDPPDVLLITPESIEVLLTSSTIDATAFFGEVGAVVVDEIHAFAGDDRGWHLISVIDRVERLSSRRIQRIGLSATVGNPRDLLSWLTAGSAPGRVVAPENAGGKTPEVEIDFTGSIGNAAKVISMLHRGEKRLVFIDSRSQAESLAARLRELDVATFVSHSSLPADERRRAETAFAESRDCVIVATSTLELGIDVGDLDRVIQIDCPPAVASFLQRLGRTGRRAGSARNCLFLITRNDHLLRAAALVRLWEAGYVEPIVPPPLPYTVLVQQVLALCLQSGDRGRTTWHRWLPTFLEGGGISPEDGAALVDSMIEQGYLIADDGILFPGPKAEKSFGRRHWMALFSVFNAPPLISVLHGRVPLGSVHELSFARGPVTLSLAGRGWVVKNIDWRRRVAWVELSETRGQSRWISGGTGLAEPLCRSAKTVLGGARPACRLSWRATDRLDMLSELNSWVSEGHGTLIDDGESITWWTFGGGLLNAAIATRLGTVFGEATHGSYAVKVKGSVEASEVEAAIARLCAADGASPVPAIDDESIAEMKFAECVPPGLLERLFRARFSSAEAWARVRAEPRVIRRDVAEV